ncbi:MAG: KH domain-containing protein [Candidatus Daviesbacteria bacterium]|nr:MAG: KH domain-containing protein [Candidatus Daviesbacteria bacterium]
MQEQVSEILDNILGLLLLEGSYDIEENDEQLRVEIATPDAGRLIGFKGESLEGLQLLISLMMLKKNPDAKIKRVILDVAGWRKQKEENLAQQAQRWADQVISNGEAMELEPMSPWQRRIVHLALQDLKGIETESVGEGKERHLVIKPAKI